MTQDELTTDIAARDGRARLEHVVQNLACYAQATGRDAAANLLGAVERALVAQRLIGAQG
ncbi:hypothetical protein ACE7GA_04445 [Roseomonas sp. CCTCC AB2023176]|uniref:hypothetical protein n=1 Tax=Roseomonas sp. CCTCC AB2023176 TaxID=3342640 RepID=UPI0035D642E7